MRKHNVICLVHQLLRTHFLQGNSQCHNVDQFIEEQTALAFKALGVTQKQVDLAMKREQKETPNWLKQKLKNADFQIG
jgi:hypothetical protein